MTSLSVQTTLGETTILQITCIDHISVAVPELEPAVEMLEQVFGFRRVGAWTNEIERYRGISLSVPGTSGINWELLAPSDEDSHIWRFLQSPNGPGLHHVALEVPNITTAIDELRRLNIEPWGPSPSVSDKEPTETFIHPRRGGNGFLIQLQSRTDYDSSLLDERTLSYDHMRHSLGIVSIDHLSHAHNDREELTAWYERVLGMHTYYRATDPLQEDDEPSFYRDVLESPTGQMRWEVLQPGNKQSFIQRFLDQRGPAIHHVTFEVENWERALSACEHHGLRTIGTSEGEEDGARWKETFIDPRRTGGLLAQIFWQSRPGVWV